MKCTVRNITKKGYLYSNIDLHRWKGMKFIDACTFITFELGDQKYDIALAIMM